MKKVYYLVMFCVCVSVLLLCICACTDSLTMANNETKSEPNLKLQNTESKYPNHTTTDSSQPTSIEPESSYYDIPGMCDPDRIVEGMVAMAHLQDGVNKLVNPIDLSEFFESTEAEKHILAYAVIGLDNGSVIGYICYRDSQTIQTTSMGDKIVGVAYEFVATQIEELAADRESAWFLDSSTDYAYFIVSDEVDKMVGYYYSCKEGNLPD